MTVRLLHTADLHLGGTFPGFGSFARERQLDVERTFDRIVNLAIKRDVHCVIVAGDLFDSNKVGGDVVGKVQEGFNRLAGRGIAVVMIPGTHDHMISANSIYRRFQFPSVHLLADPYVSSPLQLSLRGNSISFYGFTYQTHASANAIASMRRREGEGFHIGLLHGSLKGSPEWDVRNKDLPFTVTDLASLGLDYVALGHYHGYTLIEREGRIIACYPGSPEARRFGETGERFVVVAEVGRGNAVVEKVPVQSRQVREYTVDASPYDHEQLVAELSRLAAPDRIVRVRLFGVVEAPLDAVNLHGRLQANCAWAEIIDDTDLFDSGFVKRLEREDTIRGLFVRKMQDRLARAETDRERELCHEVLKVVFGKFDGRDAS